MKIVFFGNNWVGLQVLTWLKQQKEEIVGLVVHSPQKRKFGKELIEASHLDESRIFDGSKLKEPAVMNGLSSLGADLGLSVFFGHILQSEIVRLFPKGCINLHPAFLPFNKGAYPNVWSIIDGTPAGVSLHYIDEGVDTGDIIAQANVASTELDTGETLYKRLELACVELFKKTWSSIKSGKIVKQPQDRTQGTSHRMADIERIDKIDLYRSYTAKELINILRARTFPPYSGAYFIREGKKIYMRLQLLEDDKL